MAELKEVRKEYYIPDNFIGEGRILQGKIRIRYLIEGVVLSLGFLAVGLAIILSFPDMALELKIAIMAILVVPPAALGIVGFNGDPISVVIKSAAAWMKNKNTMLYNPNPKLLKRDPMLSVINKQRAMDGIVETIEQKRQENIARKANLNIVEGEDYTFADDEYVDQYTKRLKPNQIGKSKTKMAQPVEKEYVIPNQTRKKRAQSVDTISLDEDVFVDIGSDESLSESFLSDAEQPHVSVSANSDDVLDVDIDFFDGGDLF